MTTFDVFGHALTEKGFKLKQYVMQFSHSKIYGKSNADIHYELGAPQEVLKEPKAPQLGSIY